MFARVRRLLDIRPGEGWPLVASALYVAVAVASFLLAKPIRNGLFLQEFGPYRLVYVYVGVPAVLALFVPAYQAIARRVGQRMVATGSLLFLAANVLLFWAGFRRGGPAWLSAAFYIWVNCYGVIAPVQAWSFANTVFDTRQARRLFGLVGAGASLGAIAGGIMAQTLVGPLGTVNLLLVLAALIASAALLVNLAWGVRRRDLVPRRDDITVPLRESLAEVWRSPYLRLLAAMVLLVAVATQWVGFMFSVAATERFAGDADSLTRFFGQFNFAMGVAALIVQLTLTGPLLRRFGLTATLLVLPIALASGSLLVGLVPALWSVVVLSAFDQGLRFSIDKASFELLYLPLSPAVKGRVKGAIDLIVNRLADAAGGLLLGLATQGFVMLPGLGLGLRGVAWLTLGASLVWVGVAVALRREYVRAVHRSLRSFTLDASDAGPRGLDRSTFEALAVRLRDGAPDEIVAALEVFAAEHPRVLHPAVRALVGHEQARVRRRAIALLNEAADLGATEVVQRRLYDPDLGVRTEALRFLARHAHVDPLERISELGDFPDHSIQAGLVAYLAHDGAGQNLDAARVILAQMIGASGEAGEPTRLEAARLLGALPPVFAAELEQLIADPSLDVARAAIESCGAVRAGGLAGRLVGALTRADLAPSASSALVSLGDAAVVPLSAALGDAAVPIDIRRRIPALLAAIGSSSAQVVLSHNLLQGDAELRLRVVEGLNEIAERERHLPLDRLAVETVLAAEIIGHYRSYQILERLGEVFEPRDPVAHGIVHSIEAERQRIFRLMELRWPQLDLGAARVGLESSNRAVRANALEFLDNVLEPGMRRLLVPLIDPQVSVAERAETGCKVAGVGIETTEAAVAALLASDDGWLRSCGAYAAGALDLKELAGAVEGLASSDDLLVRETARAASARLRGEAPSAEFAPPPRPRQRVWDLDREAAGL